MISVISSLSCHQENNSSNEHVKKVYKVKKLQTELVVDSNWRKPQLQNANTLSIDLYMGDHPKHKPKTKAKLLYDDENIYIIFRVIDRYVKSVATEYHGKVWDDSCVEFFFTPSENLKDGYFNLEINCGGTLLCRYQTAPNKNITFLEIEDCKKIEVAHSLPRIVKEEITTPVIWTLEYRLPFEVIKKYCPQAQTPLSQVKWRANFFKCANKSSHPHWLVWNFIDNSTPAFHMPEYFGILEFTE
jgi:hypothetical protein